MMQIGQFHSPSRDALVTRVRVLWQAREGVAILAALIFQANLAGSVVRIEIHLHRLLGNARRPFAEALDIRERGFGLGLGRRGNRDDHGNCELVTPDHKLTFSGIETTYCDFNTVLSARAALALFCARRNTSGQINGRLAA